MTEAKSNISVNILTGGIAGIIGTATIFPIDLVKTRLQSHKGTGSFGYFNLTRSIVRNEGIRGLYRGLLANLMGVAPEKAIKLAANDFFRGQLSTLSAISHGNPDKLPMAYGMLAGALAGTVQVIATNPMETVKIRMQMATLSLGKSSHHTVSMTSLPTTFSVVRDLGMRGLYRGSLATLSRDVPFSMIFFQMFATFKGQFAKLNSSGEAQFPFIFASGISAGALGAFLVTPMDVVKTRYQASRSSKSLSEIYRSILLFEGPRSFFKGSVQRCFIVAPLFGISLTIYELQRQFLNKTMANS